MPVGVDKELLVSVVCVCVCVSVCASVYVMAKPLSALSPKSLNQGFNVRNYGSADEVQAGFSARP